MTPNDLDEYLKVFARHQIMAGAFKLPGGAEVHFTVAPTIPMAMGTEPTPGGWKSLEHLDNPTDLRDNYEGKLPT